MSKLAGKVAVVTEASNGIGAPVSNSLAGAGAQVIVNYASSKAGTDAVVEVIGNAGGQAVAVHGDVANPADVKVLVNAAVTEFGRLDVAINNSGIWANVPIENVTEEQFRHSFDVNVLGPSVMIREALKHITVEGNVINISSDATTPYPPGSGVPAKELGPCKIGMDTILLGMVDTEGNRSAGFVGSTIEDLAVSQTPPGRIGRPQDIADVAVFLASDDVRWLTGQRLLASGALR